MNRRGVNHNQIWSWLYDSDRKVLDVRFKMVGHYEYANVPHDLGANLMELPADEAVHLFDSKIEGKYASKRLGD